MVGDNWRSVHYGQRIVHFRRNKSRYQGLGFGYDLGLLNCSGGTVFCFETVKQVSV